MIVISISQGQRIDGEIIYPRGRSTVSYRDTHMILAVIICLTLNEGKKICQARPEITGRSY